MLQRRVGCTWSTGAIPVGLATRSATQSHGGDLAGDVLDHGRHVLLDVTEVELHADEVGKGDPVDDDPWRPRRSAVVLVPFEPEENGVPAPGAVVAVVG